jgi:riboflavin biosynthesis pyrimidine reductase
VPVMIVTTSAGAKRLATLRMPDSVRIRTVRGGKAGSINPAAVIAQAQRGSRARLILVEGGPRLLGDFYAAKLVDEQFLTLAPQIAGREFGDGRLGLVMGRTFAPQQPLWGRLTDVRRGASHLFLRYAFASR